MPRRPKKKPLPTPQWEFELSFDDPTMVETEGVFSEVKPLIEGEFPYPEVWTIKTRLSILSPFGMGEMILNCKNDGSVYVIGYYPSHPDKYANPDVRALSRWCQQAGWKVPQPAPLLVRDQMEFWKHMWETTLVDSEFLDERYGMRRSIIARTDTEDDEIDDE